MPPPQSQHREAFEALYRQHGGRVLLMFVRLSGNRADAEDLTQEAFVRAWNSWESFRSDSSASTWLHTIAIRTFADWRRQSLRRPWESEEPVEPEANADVRALLPGADIDLERAIARLPAQMRAAFVLHYIEGFSLDEIAEQLGKSIGTIKAQLHAARARLRSILAPGHH
jgi:RNA polymerase sigma-70 factor (ECF subfamily)